MFSVPRTEHAYEQLEAMKNHQESPFQISSVRNRKFTGLDNRFSLFAQTVKRRRLSVD